MRYLLHKHTRVTGQKWQKKCEYNNVQFNELITVLPYQVVITSRAVSFRAKLKHVEHVMHPLQKQIDYMI